MAATIGFYLSGVIAIAIIFIGCRFLLAPTPAREEHSEQTLYMWIEAVPPRWRQESRP